MKQYMPRLSADAVNVIESNGNKVPEGMYQWLVLILIRTDLNSN